MNKRIFYGPRMNTLRWCRDGLYICTPTSTASGRYKNAPQDKKREQGRNIGKTHRKAMKISHIARRLHRENQLTDSSISSRSDKIRVSISQSNTQTPSSCSVKLY
jgi:hypothetical protein